MRTTPCRACVLALLLLVAVPSGAYHGTQYQYNVAGYVLDAERDPIADSPVIVFLGGLPVGSTLTRASGYYLIPLQLHENDWGRDLRIRTEPATVMVRIDFTPGETRTPQWHYVNIVGGELVEEQLVLRDLMGWLTGIAVVVVAVVALVLGVRWWRRRRRRLAKQQAPAAPAGGRSATAKSRSRRRRGKSRRRG
ncbi:MAG: hypothetical protein R3202_02830 [Candidatus Competibacterales bacterium]|nr:hypothetical protein [Candidatus Competibacterales bacterium]